MSRRFVLSTILALAMAPGAFAEEQLIFVRGGDVYQGEVLASDANSITVKLSEESGGTTHKADADMFEPYFFYQVRDKALGDDVAGRIELAKYCVANDMFSRAKAQMDRCRSTDPAAVEEFMKTEFPKIKEGLAEQLMKASRRALAAGSTTNAMKYASAILTKLDGTKLDEEARAMIAKVQEQVDAAQEKARAQIRRSAATDEKIEAKKEAAKRDSILAPAEKDIDEGERLNQRGLTTSGMSEQKSAFETAADRFKSAIRRCDEGSKTTTEPDLLATLSEMSKTATEGAVQAYLNLANMYSARGSYVEATNYCNQALAVDPNSTEAKSARATISTTNGGWNRRGGRR